MKRKNTARNLPFHIGDSFEMWTKIMKEVKERRYAGPFVESELPFSDYVQSPIGLVPKAGLTRLIFHLSHDFSDTELSINACNLKEICTVRYKDLDFAVKECIKLLQHIENKVIYFGKTDLVSAFRILPIKPSQRRLLLMKAHHLLTHIIHFFVDKHLPFGSSKSCAHFNSSQMLWLQYWRQS